MTCEEAKGKFVDFWREALPDGERQGLEAHLASCSDCASEVEALGALWSRLESLPDEDPGPGVRDRFEVMLDAYRVGRDQARSPSFMARLDGWLETRWPRRPALQLALTLFCLVAGGASGLLARREPAPASDMAALSSEVQQLRTLVTVSLLKQPSPAERLSGVSWSYRVQQPKPAVLDALVETLNHDPNVNVRLAAVDALTQFSNQDAVRRELVLSILRQDSPLVQIALIDLMVQMRERDSLEALRQLLGKPEVNPTVRERARWGVEQIS